MGIGAKATSRKAAGPSGSTAVRTFIRYTQPSGIGVSWASMSDTGSGERMNATRHISS